MKSYTELDIINALGEIKMAGITGQLISKLADDYGEHAIEKPEADFIEKYVNCWDRDRAQLIEQMVEQKLKSLDTTFDNIFLKLEYLNEQIEEARKRTLTLMAKRYTGI